jgi:hypothetical protein
MDKVSPNVKEPCMAKDDSDRAARLAEALRTNLRKRKAQARETAEVPAPQEDRHPRGGGNP